MVFGAGATPGALCGDIWGISHTGIGWHNNIRCRCQSSGEEHKSGQGGEQEGLCILDWGIYPGCWPHESIRTCSLPKVLGKYMLIAAIVSRGGRKPALCWQGHNWQPSKCLRKIPLWVTLGLWIDSPSKDLITNSCYNWSLCMHINQVDQLNLKPTWHSNLRFTVYSVTIWPRHVVLPHLLPSDTPSLPTGPFRTAAPSDYLFWPHNGAQRLL